MIMEDNEIVKIGYKNYKYNEFYKRLELDSQESQYKESIACPICKNTSFTISYGKYECIANCKCGHSMTIYDG